jgi:hypothetical protein
MEGRLAPAGPPATARRNTAPPVFSLGYAASAAVPLGCFPAAAAAAQRTERGPGSSIAAEQRTAVLFVTSVRAVRAVWQTCRTAQKALEALPFEVVVKDVRHAPLALRTATTAPRSPSHVAARVPPSDALATTCAA